MHVAYAMQVRLRHGFLFANKDDGDGATVPFDKLSFLETSITSVSVQ